MDTRSPGLKIQSSNISFLSGLSCSRTFRPLKDQKPVPFYNPKNIIKIFGPYMEWLQCNYFRLGNTACLMLYPPRHLDLRLFLMGRVFSGHICRQCLSSSRWSVRYGGWHPPGLPSVEQRSKSSLPETWRRSPNTISHANIIARIVRNAACWQE